MSFSGYWNVSAERTCLLGGSKDSSMPPSPGVEDEMANGEDGRDMENLTEMTSPKHLTIGMGWQCQG